MNRTLFFLTAAALVCLAACRRKEEPAYTRSAFIMSVPAEVKVYGADAAAGKLVADAVFKEWKRVEDEFSFSEPYSQVSLVNKKAYGDWVRIDDELYHLIALSLDYYKLTDGAFDITFAPLWPIWKEAAATRTMPAKEDIAAALSNVGSGYVQLDAARRMVRFSRPVQINLGGVLRGYCFARAYRVLKELHPAYPVELRLGGNMLAYGKRNWEYRLMDPFKGDKLFGRFLFGDGVVMSSSGKEHFVQIGGKLYSDILDLKTGYPLKDFSTLVVYMPNLDEEDMLSTTVLAVMGREKAFALLSHMKNYTAVWIDGAGKETVASGPGSSAKWEKARGFF